MATSDERTFPVSGRRHSARARAARLALQDGARVIRYRRSAVVQYTAAALVAVTVFGTLTVVIARGASGAEWLIVVMVALLALFFLVLLADSPGRWAGDRRLALGIRPEGLLLPRTGLLPWDLIRVITVATFENKHQGTQRYRGLAQMMGMLDEAYIAIGLHDYESLRAAHPPGMVPLAALSHDGRKDAVACVFVQGLARRGPDAIEFFDVVDELAEAAVAAGIDVILDRR